jgi:[CysO sulfur-carrier protein]-S-L-cysteine hydrolase
MNADADLVMPRRLAIQILHEAQIAQPGSICGVVGSRDGAEPSSFLKADVDALSARSERLWARLWSEPTAPAVPTAPQLAGGGLYLLVSLNTKGVLEMRAWELRAGAPFERVLKVQD